MFDNYSKEIVTGFNFNEIFEGKIIDIKDNNQCLVYIYKFFLNSVADEDVIKETNIIDIKEGLTNNKIENINGILCKPLYINTTVRKMSKGDDVLVIFLNGDPQKPYYIDAKLGKNLNILEEETIFKSGDISITCNSGKDAKVTIKVKDTEFILPEGGKLPTINADIVIGNGDGSNSDNNINGTVIQDVNKFTPLQKQNLLIDIENIKDNHIHLKELSEFFKLEDEFKSYEEVYNTLITYSDIIIGELETVTDIDITEYTNNFLNYYKAYNNIMKEMLKRKGNGGFGTEVGPTEGDVLEGIIKDMIYVTDITASGQFIKDIIEDNIFSKEEKVKITREVTKIYEEKRTVETLAPIYYANDNFIEVKYNKYIKAFNSLRDYIDPMLERMNEDDDIDGQVFYDTFNNLFKIRFDLLDEIFNISKEVYEVDLKSLLSYSLDRTLTKAEKDGLTSKFNAYDKDKILLTSLANIYNVSTVVIDNVNKDLNNLFHNKLKGLLVNKIDQDISIYVERYNSLITQYIKERNNLFKKIISVSKSFIETFMGATSISSNFVNTIVNSNFKFPIKLDNLTDDEVLKQYWSFPERNAIMDIIKVNKDEKFEQYLHTNAKTIIGTLSIDMYKCDVNENMMFSLWANAENATKITIEIKDAKDNNVSIPYSLTILPSEDGNLKRYHIPMTIIKELELQVKRRPNIVITNLDYVENDLNYGCIIDITQLLLSFGNSLGDWSPAREDNNIDLGIFEETLADYNSSITQTVDKIKLEVEGFEQTTSQLIDEMGNRVTTEEFTKKVSQLTVELGKIDLLVKDTTGKVTELEAEIDGMDTNVNIEEIREQLANLTVELGSVMAELKDVSQKFIDIETELDGKATNTEIEIINSTLVEWGATLTSLGGSIDNLNAITIKHESEISGLNVSMSETENKILTMEGTLDGLELSVKANKETITEVENTLTGQSTDITTIKEQYSGISIDMQKINQAVISNTTNITSNKDAINNVNSSLIEVDNKYAGIIVDLENGITQEISSVKQTTDKIVGDLNGLDNTLTGSIKDLADNMGLTEKEFRDKFGDLDVEVSLVNSKLTEQSSSIETLKEEINLKVNKDVLDTTISNITYASKQLLRRSDGQYAFSPKPDLNGTMDVPEFDYKFLGKFNKMSNVSGLNPDGEVDFLIKYEIDSGTDIPIYRFHNVLKPTKKGYVFSIYCKSADVNDHEVAITLSKGTPSLLPVTSQWKEYVFSNNNIEGLDSSNNYVDVHFSTGSKIFIYHPMLASGTAKMDWVKNQKDFEEEDKMLEGSLTTINTSLTTQISEITMSLNSIKTEVSTIKDISLIDIQDQLDNKPNLNEFNQVSDLAASLDVTLNGSIGPDGNPIPGIVGQVHDIQTTTENTIDELTNTNNNLTNVTSKVGNLEVFTEQINMGVSNLDKEIEILEKLSVTHLINDFSTSGHLERWSLKPYIAGINYKGSVGTQADLPSEDVKENDCYNLTNGDVFIYSANKTWDKSKYHIKLELKESPEYKYEVHLSTNIQVDFISDMYNISATKSYKHFISLKSLTDGNEYSHSISPYGKDKNYLGAYIDIDKNPSNKIDFTTRKDKYIKYKNFNAYSFASDSLVPESIDYVIKGNSDHSLRFHEDTVTMFTVLSFNRNKPSGETGTIGTIVIARPSIAEIDSFVTEQEIRLSKAEIKITDDSIISTVMDSDRFVDNNGQLATKTELSSQIEQTKSAITTTLKEEYLNADQIGEQYVNIGEFKETADAWTATFSDTGGYNLLKNTEGKEYVNNNRGEKIPDRWYLTSHDYGHGVVSNARFIVDNDNVTWLPPNYRAITARADSLDNSSMIWNQSIETDIGQDYTFSCYMATHRCAAYLSAIDSNGGWITDKGIQNGQYEGGNNIKTGWYKMVITFKAKTSRTTLQLLVLNKSKEGANGKDIYGWFIRPMANIGKEPIPWSPNASEQYAGITQITEDGVKVSHSESGTFTKLSSEGLEVLNSQNGNVMAYFGRSNSAYIDTLRVNKIISDDLPSLAPSHINTDIYVRAGSNGTTGTNGSPFGTIQEALDYIKGTSTDSVRFLPKTIVLHVASGTYNENLRFRNVRSVNNSYLELRFDDHTTFIGVMSFINTEYISVISEKPIDYEALNRPIFKPHGSADMFSSIVDLYGVKNSYVGGINFQGYDRTKVLAIYTNNGNNYVTNCDFHNMREAVSISYGRSIMYRCRGSEMSHRFALGDGSIAYVEGPTPNVGDWSANRGSHCYNLDGVSTVNSKWYQGPPPPPPPTESSYTKDFHASSSNHKSYRRSQGWRSDLFIQGGWEPTLSSLGVQHSQVNFGSELKNFKGGGRVTSFQIYLERLNTSHGYSSGANIWMRGLDLGTLNIGQGRWISISDNNVINEIINSGIVEVKIPSSSNYQRDYIRYNTNCKIKMTVIK